jgi:hypothetical protein
LNHPGNTRFMQEVAAILIALGAAIFFAAMAWVGNHVN